MLTHILEGDIHPNDDGYGVLLRAFQDAYERVGALLASSSTTAIRGPGSGTPGYLWAPPGASAKILPGLNSPSGSNAAPTCCIAAWSPGVNTAFM